MQRNKTHPPSPVTQLSPARCCGFCFFPPATECTEGIGGSPSSGSFRDIKHVVLLMQENRSFDHYFGTMAGVRGFDDANALLLPNGKSVFYQPDAENPEGYLLPFHLDTRKTSAQKIPSTSHAWSVQHESWNGGKMDRWLPAHRKADGVKRSIRHGLSHPGGYSVSVRSGRSLHHLRCLSLLRVWPDLAQPHVLDDRHALIPDGRFGGPMISNDAIPGGFRWTTYAERLEKAGISWKVYQEAAQLRL